MKTQPNPGSPEAIEKGCTCPRMDNGNGKGFLCSDGSRFIWSGDCPLHNRDEITKGRAK